MQVAFCNLFSSMKLTIENTRKQGISLSKYVTSVTSLSLIHGIYFTFCLQTIPVHYFLFWFLILKIWLIVSVVLHLLCQHYLGLRQNLLNIPCLATIPVLLYWYFSWFSAKRLPYESRYLEILFVTVTWFYCCNGLSNGYSLLH